MKETAKLKDMILEKVIMQGMLFEHYRIIILLLSKSYANYYYFNI